MDSLNNSSPNGKSPRKGGRKFVFSPPPEAPVFHPTPEEWKDPLEYIKSIRQAGERSGICKIVPPSWRSPFVLDMNKLKFTPRIQRINELEARTRIKLNFNDKLTKFFALSGKTFQVPVMEKTSLDLYTLHRKVKEFGGSEVVNKGRLWGDIAASMGFTSKSAQYTLKSHYDSLILPFLQAQAKSTEDSDREANKENCENDVDDKETREDVTKSSNGMAMGKSGPAAMRELRSLRFLGPGPKMAVCDGGVLQKGLRTRGKKIMYEFDPLAKYMCKGCKKGDLDETLLVMCHNCEDRYHHSCLIPPLSLETCPPLWRCPKCVAAEGYKPLEEFGFAQAEREYTLNEFKIMADEFKRNYFNNADPDHATVEQEFWRVVSSIDEAVTVEYGADLHVIEHGSGFPRINQPCVEGVDKTLFERYAKSPWNLNNLPVLEDSVLRHISADISGMKIPWMYAGMCFATFCWHNEDHWSYSINYLHLGDAKTWYGVPGSYAEQFEEAMQKAAPELFESQPDLLHQLVTIMNPADIMAAGVPLFRTDQKRGEFVITFPRAYHAGFNQGFNFAEACNFAPADWLVIGRECITHYARLRRNCVFSHDELICKMATMYDSLERDMGLVLLKDMKLMVESERLRRTRAMRLGVGNAMHVEFDKLPDDERQCCVCNTTVFLSAVTCPCDYTRLVCLDHITKLCRCDPKKYIMKYQLKLDLLQNLLNVIVSKLCGFDNWTARVQDALNTKGKKVSLSALTDLFIEAKDKEFPPSELIELLEYHVRRCIECSALSKALVANCNRKDSPSKITLEDLELFHYEVEKLPCSIPEELAVKELLDKAKTFTSNALKVLGLKEPSKALLLPVMRIGQSLNLDLPELQELEKKLVELEWAEQVDFAIHSGAAVDVQKLSEEGKHFPDSHIVKKTRQNLAQYLNDSESNLSIAIVSVQSIAGVMTNSFMKTEKDMMEVLNGDLVLYLHELEGLLVRGRKEIPGYKILGDLERSVTIARNWEAAAKKLFMKKSDHLTLMESLWPRKFTSRPLYYAMQIKRRASGIESLINTFDTDRYYRANYKSALTKELQSLEKLRHENKRKMDTDDFGLVKCPCGNSVDRSAITCELCETVMHLKCFRLTDTTKASKMPPSVWDENFRARRLCGYCKRTNRPPVDSVVRLIESMERMKVKIPECYAVKCAFDKVRRWRRNISGIINPETLIGLSNEVLTFFRKFHAKRYSSEVTEDLHAELRLVISTPVRGITKTTLLMLKSELIHGNRFEITPPELNHIWNIINPLWIHAEIESRLFNGHCYPLRGVSDCQPPGPIPTFITQLYTPKRQLKRKPRPTPTPSSKTNGPKSKSPPKKRKKNVTQLKKKYFSGPPPPPPSTSLTIATVSTEEHDSEARCAAVNCKKPTDSFVPWVFCDGACAQWFHMKCVDLDKRDANDLDEYICAKCVCDKVCDQVTEGLNSTKDS